MFCSIGAHEWDDPDDRLSSEVAYSQWQSQQLHHFDGWLIDSMGVDPNNAVYNSFCTYTKTGLDVASLAVGCYGIVRGGIELANLSRFSQEANTIGRLAAKNCNFKHNENALTNLYRAVKPAELADIQNTGILRNLGSAEGKYFTTTPQAASSYAKQAVMGFGDPPYTIIEVQVPKTIFEGLSSVNVDRGISAWVIPNERLFGLTPKVHDYMIIPK